MKKKATVILVVSSLAFLIAIILFFATVEETRPGTGDKILGETEMEIFRTYSDGEEMLNYIDLAATYSLGEAQRKQGELVNNFKAEFGKYLNDMNTQFRINPPLDTNKYVITVKNNALTGMYDGKVTINRPQHKITYSFMPNFKIKRGLYLNSTAIERQGA